MKVLVTGAFGTVGLSTLRALLAADHAVRAFDLPTPTNRRQARRLAGRTEVRWGDVRRRADVDTALLDQDAVIHLAAVVPPRSEEWPCWSRAVNVGGVENLLAAARASPRQPRLVFASSASVFGPTQDRAPPRTMADPVQPTDAYTRHKVAAEDAIRHSGLPWTILRLSWVPPLALPSLDRRTLRQLFAIPPDTRIEFLHPDDAAVALMRAASGAQALERTLLVGGGPGCQLHYREVVQALLGIWHIATLPEDAFGTTPFYTDWLATDESQQLLGYQRHSFQDFTRQLAALARPWPLALCLAQPLVRWWLLRHSRRQPARVTREWGRRVSTAS